jgi:hypothetical protein
MIECAGCLGFADEELTAAGIGDPLRRKAFQSHDTAETGVAGFPYLAHATLPKLFEDSVRAHRRTWPERHAGLIVSASRTVHGRESL